MGEKFVRVKPYVRRAPKKDYDEEDEEEEGTLDKFGKKVNWW